MSAGRRSSRIVGAGAGVLFGLALLCWWLWTGGSPGSGVVEFRVGTGETVAQVADSLVAHGLLRSPRVFVLGARLTGRDRDVRAGLYVLPLGTSPRDLLARLTRGAMLPVRFTIAEGSEAVAAAAVVAAQFRWDAAEFLAAADAIVVGLLGADAAAYERILAAERARGGRPFPLCEGYLFPETYLVDEGTSARDVATLVIVEGLAAWADELAASPRGVLGRHGVLTLASIVEAETPLAAEMPLVAAVYLNRLDGGRRLEADPTIAHAQGKRGRRILYSDLEADSAFNTYRRAGLPPGPIGSPGLAAIRAVLAPEPDFPAFFFVADGKGGHVFSETLAEHERAVEAYRRRRAGGG
jgi:UPF0755 protein